eukprot:53299_1
MNQVLPWLHSVRPYAKQSVGTYYKDLGKPYDALFSSYCEGNGLEDEDAIKEEMEHNVSNCILLEFDAEFPLKEKMTDKARAQFIYNLIHQCMKNPNIQFGASRSIPHCMLILHSILNMDIRIHQISHVNPTNIAPLHPSFAQTQSFTATFPIILNFAFLQAAL